MIAEFLSVPVELLCSGFMLFTEHIFKLSEDKDSFTGELPVDCTQFNADDTLSEEFENPRNSTDTSTWRENRPAMKVSLKKSAWFAFQVTVLTGGFIGVGCIFFIYFQMKIIFVCDWKVLRDSSIPLEKKRPRIIGESYLASTLYLWQPLMLLFVFRWPLIKQVNLVTFTLIGIFFDLAYRFLVAVYGLYYPPWIPYPLNILYLIMILVQSFSVGRIFRGNIFSASLFGFKLCAQFIIGAPVFCLFASVLCPLFAHLEGILKVAMIALSYSVGIIPKILSKRCVSGLYVINPGFSYVLVSTASSAVCIAVKFMLAEFKSLWAFIALSIGEQTIHLVYQLIVKAGESHEDKSQYERILLSGLEADPTGPFSATKMKERRSQRLAADLTIHEMMSSAAAVVLSVGLMTVYGIIHRILRPEEYQEMIVDLLIRIVLALLVEIMFNVIFVMMLTRTRNIPVLKVWNVKWKSHLIVCIVTVYMIVNYYANKILVILSTLHEAEGKIDNC